MRWHNMTAHGAEEDIMWLYAAQPSMWDMAWMFAGATSATMDRALSPSADKAIA